MKFLNLHDPGKKAADISEDGEHEGDADDAEEKAEDATSDRLRRHVPVTDRCDDWEGEKARLKGYLKALISFTDLSIQHLRKSTP